MKRTVVALFALLAACDCPQQPLVSSHPTATSVPVSDTDRKLFESVFELGLLDPKGLNRVQGTVNIRTCWGQIHTGSAPGWVKGDRMILDNLRETKIPARVRPVDLALEARRALDFPPGDDGEMPGPNFGTDEEIVPYYPTLRYLYWAAWLYRSRRTDLAVELLARVRTIAKPYHPTDEGLLDAVAKDLVAQEFTQALYALNAGDDAAADVHIRRFERLKGAAEFGDGAILIDEMNRRRSEGTLGKAERDPQKLSIAELIQDLDQVRVRPMLDGMAITSEDPRVQALIAQGESALPALLDCLENDTRYTKCFEFGRAFVAEKDLVPVRYASSKAIEGILGISEFEKAPFTRVRGDSEGNDRREDAAAIRQYWSRYGSLPFSVRMVKMLADRKVPEKALREAAQNLAFSRRAIEYGFFSWDPRTAEERSRPHPAVESFKDPTAAESILRAYDRDPKGEHEYFRSLIELNDARIVPELARRAKAASATIDRFRYAELAFKLGHRDLLWDAADEVRAGRVKETGEEYFRIVSILVEARDPSCDDALLALAESDHPNHRMVYEKLAEPYNRDWWPHPFMFKFVRRILDDDGQNTWEWSIQGEWLVRFTPGSVAIRDQEAIPDFLKPQEVRSWTCAGRWRDNAMRLLHDHAWGSLPYHPLRKDAGQRVSDMKRMLDTLGSRWRALTPKEEKALGKHAPLLSSVVVPDLAPLDRPATAQDVAEWKAIFHLNGQGKARPVDRVGALLKGTRTPVVILQSEEAPSGEVIYGVVGEGLAGPRKASELEFNIPD